MDSCPRNFTKEQMIEGLKAGRTLYLDRADAPEMDDIRALEKEGLITTELQQVDEQYSRLKIRWKNA